MTCVDLGFLNEGGSCEVGAVDWRFAEAVFKLLPNFNVPSDELPPTVPSKIRRLVGTCFSTEDEGAGLKPLCLFNSVVDVLPPTVISSNARTLAKIAPLLWIGGGALKTSA